MLPCSDKIPYLYKICRYTFMYSFVSLEDCYNASGYKDSKESYIANLDLLKTFGQAEIPRLVEFGKTLSLIMSLLFDMLISVIN